MRCVVFGFDILSDHNSISGSSPRLPVRPSAHDKSSSSCMTALIEPRAARIRNTPHRNCSQRAPAVICYCLVDPTQAKCFQSSSFTSLIAVYNNTHSLPAQLPRRLILQKCPPQHLSLNPAIPLSAPSCAYETETTPSYPVTQLFLPQPTMHDLPSQNTPPQRSLRPTLS